MPLARRFVRLGAPIRPCAIIHFSLITFVFHHLETIAVFLRMIAYPFARSFRPEGDLQGILPVQRRNERMLDGVDGNSGMKSLGCRLHMPIPRCAVDAVQIVPLYVTEGNNNNMRHLDKKEHK